MKEIKIFNNYSQRIGKMTISNGYVVYCDKLEEIPDYYNSVSPLSDDEDILIMNYLKNVRIEL